MTAVPADFDARFSALFRRYEYRVTDAPWGAEPLRRHDTLAWPRPLDLDALNAAAAGLVGEHDFAAFCRRKEHATTIRAVTRLDWRRDPDGILVATVQADAFCQAMVRSLVGAHAGGRRRPARPVDWPAHAADAAGSAPARSRWRRAHGLTLVAVGYPDDPAEYAQRADADPPAPGAESRADRTGQRPAGSAVGWPVLPAACRRRAVPGTVGPAPQHVSAGTSRPCRTR